MPARRDLAPPAALKYGCWLQTLLNVADTHIALGEAHAARGQPEEARAAFQRGVTGYAQACSLCSSEAGDDLPGLLHNWGVGLHTWATHTQVHDGPKPRTWSGLVHGVEGGCTPAAAT